MVVIIITKFDNCEDEDRNEYEMDIREIFASINLDKVIFTLKMSEPEEIANKMFKMM